MKSQRSVVQASLSLHVIATDVHPTPGLHASEVQASPSLQDAGICTHPERTLQPSSVQGSPSSQVTAPWQPVAGAQVSTVHAFPSSTHSSLLCVQPVAGLQPSMVQAFASSHEAAMFT